MAPHGGRGVAPLGWRVWLHHNGRGVAPHGGRVWLHMVGVGSCGLER